MQEVAVVWKNNIVLVAAKVRLFFSPPSRNATLANSRNEYLNQAGVYKYINIIRWQKKTFNGAGIKYELFIPGKIISSFENHKIGIKSYLDKYYRNLGATF